jgi:hypothetical protein
MSWCSFIVSNDRERAENSLSDPGITPGSRPDHAIQDQKAGERTLMPSMGETVAPTQVVTYGVDDDVIVSVEIEPVEGFAPAGVDEIAGQVRAAVQPAVAAARAVLEQAKALAPSGVQVKFGVKVTGTANWLVAKAATEGNFEVTLSWNPEARPPATSTPGRERSGRGDGA